MAKKTSELNGFKQFIAEQGVVGLAVGFILGGAVSAFIADFVNGVVNPVIAAIFDVSSLAGETAEVGSAELLWGAVVASFINFIVIAAVVYYGVKGLRLDKLDK